MKSVTVCHNGDLCEVIVPDGVMCTEGLLCSLEVLCSRLNGRGWKIDANSDGMWRLETCRYDLMSRVCVCVWACVSPHDAPCVHIGVCVRVSVSVSACVYMCTSVSVCVC